MDELMDVHEGVKELEDKLSITLNIATSVVKKHKTLSKECVDMKDELKNIKYERQLIEDQSYLDRIDKLK